MKAIGVGHPMREPAGLNRITMVNSILWVTGMEITAASNMIIAGITIETGTSTITIIDNPDW
jgi:hypothetical protein